MTDMTKDEKRMMLYDVQEHPDRYTDEQIERLLADDDIRSFFDTNVLARMAGSKAHRQHVDVEQAWHHFQTSHSSSPRSTHYWLKAAASVIGIIFISGMVYAAVTQGWFTARTDSTPTQVQTAQGVPPTTTTPQAKPADTAPADTLKPVVFDNVPLSDILTQMAAHYQVRVVYARPEARHIRLYFTWDRQKPLRQNIDILNAFEHIHISYVEQTIKVE